MRYLLCLTLLLIPFYIFRFSIFGLSTNIFEIVLLLTFIWHLFDHFYAKKKIEIRGLDWTVIIFLFFSIIAVFLSPDKKAALGIFKGWFLAPAILYFMAKETVKKEDVYKLSIPLFVSLVIVSAWAMFQKFGLITTLLYQKGDPNFNQYLSGNVRLFGPFESPNFLAMFMVPVFFLSLGLIPRIKNTALKVVIILLYLAPLYVLYFTKSRAGLFAFVASVVIYLFTYAMNKFKVYRSANLKATLATVLAFVSFIVYKIGFNKVSDNARLEIYKYSWTMLKSHFVFGIGLANFQNKIAELSASNVSFRDNVFSYALHPHNLYLAVWLYLGVGGFITFLVVIYQFFSRAFKVLNNKMAIYPIAAMTAILAHGLFDTTYFKNDLAAIFFVCLAWVVIISNGKKVSE